jgi:hypothetical protein
MAFAKKKTVGEREKAENAVYMNPGKTMISFQETDQTRHMSDLTEDSFYFNPHGQPTAIKSDLITHSAFTCGRSRGIRYFISPRLKSAVVPAFAASSAAEEPGQNETRGYSLEVVGNNPPFMVEIIDSPEVLPGDLKTGLTAKDAIEAFRILVENPVENAPSPQLVADLYQNTATRYKIEASKNWIHDEIAKGELRVLCCDGVDSKYLENIKFEDDVKKLLCEALNRPPK